MRNRVAICAFLIAGCVYGQMPTPPTTPVSINRNYSFPPVGLGSSETAQVNVVNTAQASTAANAVAPSCTGTITFTNAAGKQVSSTPFTTTGNQVFCTSISFSTLATSGNRAEFIAAVEVTMAVPVKAPCSLVFSLETYNNSTYTTDVLLSNSAVLTGLLTPIAVP